MHHHTLYVCRLMYTAWDQGLHSNLCTKGAKYILSSWYRLTPLVYTTSTGTQKLAAAEAQGQGTV